MQDRTDYWRCSTWHEYHLKVFVLAFKSLPLSSHIVSSDWEFALYVGLRCLWLRDGPCMLMGLLWGAEHSLLSASAVLSSQAKWKVCPFTASSKSMPGYQTEHWRCSSWHEVHLQVFVLAFKPLPLSTCSVSSLLLLNLCFGARQNTGDVVPVMSTISKFLF